MMDGIKKIFKILGGLLKIFFGFLGIAFFGLIILTFLLFRYPQMIWSRIFPERNSYHTQIDLEIDGEPVTLKRTLACKTFQYVVIPLYALRREGTSCEGGAMVSVLSDGRAVVIPTWAERENIPPFKKYEKYVIPNRGGSEEKPPFREYLRSRSLHLEDGYVHVLILDNGDAPTKADLYIGPRYFQTENASVKFLGAKKWRTKRGKPTISHLGWYALNEKEYDEGSEGGDRTPDYFLYDLKRLWGSGLIYELRAEDYEQDPKFDALREVLEKEGVEGLKNVKNEDEIKDWVIHHPGAVVWPVRVKQNSDIFLNRDVTPFHIPLFNRDRTGEVQRYPGEMAYYKKKDGTWKGVSLGSDYWRLEPDVAWRFYIDGQARPDIVLVGRHAAYLTVFFDPQTRSLLVGWSVYFGPQWPVRK